MAFRYTVQSGDCLWSLARRYLGSGTRFPDIVAEHNKEAARVARFGYPDRLLPIEDANLIFVGQTLIVPLSQKIPQPGTGRRHEAETKATGLGLKMEYNFEDGKNPIKYKPMVTRDYTITSEMRPKGPITGAGGSIPRYSPASNMPFMHQIDPNDPRLQS